MMLISGFLFMTLVLPEKLFSYKIQEEDIVQGKMSTRMFLVVAFWLLFIMTPFYLTSCGGSGSDDTVILRGHIERMDGVPVQNVSVSIVDTLTNNFGHGPFIVKTNLNGNFEKEWGTTAFPHDIDKQEMLITPSHPDFSFSPSEYSFTLVDQGRLDLNFIADPIITATK